jgi:hypothetical protein
MFFTSVMVTKRCSMMMVICLMLEKYATRHADAIPIYMTCPKAKTRWRHRPRDDDDDDDDKREEKQGI